MDKRVRGNEREIKAPVEKGRTKRKSPSGLKSRSLSPYKKTIALYFVCLDWAEGPNGLRLAQKLEKRWKRLGFRVGKLEQLNINEEYDLWTREEILERL